MTAAAASPPVEVPVRAAATVMLVRDGVGGLEVFMLRRNLRSDFVGGAYLFPGGAIDAPDHHCELEAVCEGRSDAEASVRLGVDQGGLAYWVAAIRESFEEAGILLAYDRRGEIVSLDDPAVAERFGAHRRAVDSGRRRLADICRQEDLRLAVDSMYYFSHWITPEGAPRRYDTRFFVARAPDSQTPVHDDREVIANLWVRPADALDRHHAGEYEMVFPTVRSLVALSRFERAEDVLAHAASIDEVPAVCPRIVSEPGGGWRIVLPGDPEYDEVVPAALPDGIPMNKLGLTGQRPGADPIGKGVG